MKKKGVSPLMRRASLTKSVSLATALLVAATPGTLLPAAPAAAATTTTTLTPSVSLGKVITARFAQNLRADASSSAAVVGAVRAWESLGLRDSKNGWLKVVNGQGQIGWLNGAAVTIRDPDLPYWAMPFYQMKPGFWSMSLYPTRTVGTWLLSAPIRASASPTAPIVTTVQGGEQLHLLSIPAGEYVPVITQGEIQGWISRYQLMGAPTLPRTEEAILTQIAPDRFRLEVRGPIGTVGIAGGALQVGLPTEPNRRGNLAVKTAGIERLRWEPSGLVVPLTGQIGYTVISQTATNLVLELGPVAVSPPEPPTPPAPTPQPPKGPLDGKTIIVDPGHGGEDPGTSGNGLVEKILTLDMAQRVAAKLEAQGARVVLTRTSDARCGSDALYSGLTLYERGRADLACRADLAAKEKANLFLSIHYNSLPGTTASGTETYYSHLPKYVPMEPSIRLAGLLQEEVVKAVGLPDRGVQYDDFYVITYNSVPSALVEMGFISNAQDMAVLTQATVKEKAAAALAQGVNRYFQ
jgi:N-acetylmuramoyl-L-alanine amidase